VLVEVVHRVVDDAFLFFLAEFGLHDVVQNPTRLVEYLFLAPTHRSPPSIESRDDVLVHFHFELSQAMETLFIQLPG
jgi:hypothetical protein